MTVVISLRGYLLVLLTVLLARDRKCWPRWPVPQASKPHGSRSDEENPAFEAQQSAPTWIGSRSKGGRPMRKQALGGLAALCLICANTIGMAQDTAKNITEGTLVTDVLKGARPR
jgi:hypothetical protein